MGKTHCNADLTLAKLQACASHTTYGFPLVFSVCKEGTLHFDSRMHFLYLKYFNNALFLDREVDKVEK